MAARNARNLILLSRSGARGDNAIALVEELTRKGVRVEAPACNITNIEAVQRVLGDPTGLPPIKGCIQASMVARVRGLTNLFLQHTANSHQQDVLFQDMTFEDWQGGVTCKTIGSSYLHTAPGPVCWRRRLR